MIGLAIIVDFLMEALFKVMPMESIAVLIQLLATPICFATLSATVGH